MEMNQEITKNKKKFPISLVICLAIVIVCAVVSAGAIILKNIPSFQNKEISGVMEVADAETLRELLLMEADCTITLTEDIVVKEELLVNGTKTLCGDKSIIMDTSNIGSGQSVCAVNADATLVLDGATLDGNGVVNGLGVKIGGKVTCLSGNIVYGYPYGITAAGYVEIEDVTIDRTMHTAINAEYGGEVHMTGGTLTNNVYGVSVASGAYMSISGDAVLTKSNATVVTNYGKMEITGGNYTDCFDNVITNQGELSIIGDANKKIELANSKRSAIVSKKNSKLTVENCYMHDLGLHALAIEKGSEGNLTNCVIEKTGKSSFYANSSKLAMKDIEVSGGESYGLSAVKQSKIEMEDVIIKDMKSRGIGIDESQLIAKNIEVKDTKSTGLYVVGEKAVVEVEGLTLVKNGASALGIKSGKVKAKDVAIEEPKNEGVYVGEEAKLNIEDANIHKTGMHSFMNYGTADAKNIKITDSNKIGIKSSDKSSLTVKDVVIKNAASHALSVEKDSVANVTNCDIDNCGKTGKKAAVYISKSKLNMKKSTIDDASTYAIAAKDCKKADEKVVNLNDITISKTEGHGIGNVGSYVVAGNIKVSETKRAGIYTEGKDSITNMNQIEVVNAGTCGFGFKAGEITARNVTITTPKNEGVYVMKDANVKKLDNAVITDPGTQGVNVAGGTIDITVDKKYNPDNTKENGVTITNPKLTGIKCIEGTIKAQGVTITNAKNHAFDVEKGSVVTVNGCEIDKTGKAAVYILESKMTMKNAKIDNAASYGIGVRDSKKANGRVVNLDNITITNAGERGIGIFDSYVVAGNIKISNPKGAGIYTEGTDSITNMNQIEITNAGTCGFGFKAGEITARNVTISSPTDEGIVVQKDANVKKLDNVTIKNPGAHGIANFGGIVNVTVDKKYNPDNISGNGITIINPGKHGIYHEKETNGTTTLAHADILDPESGYGIWNRSGQVTGNNVTIEKSGLAGIGISKDATVKLDNANIIKAGEQGILCDGTLIVTNAIDSKNGVTITEPKTHGIYLSSTGNVASVRVAIVEAGNMGIFSQGGSVKVSGLTIDGTNKQGLQFDEKSLVEISDFNICKTGSAAVKSMGGADVTLTDGTIFADTYGIATEGAKGEEGAEDVVSKLTATDVKVIRANVEYTDYLISVGAYSELTLDETEGQKTIIDGNYTKETPDFSGRAMEVKGTFDLKGGTIQNNKADHAAGIMVRKGAAFRMTGGVVSNNTVTGKGGGIYIQSNTNGTSTISGGTISGNTAAKGGAVYIEKGSSLAMAGGMISANTATNAGTTDATRDSGGGVYVEAGATFNMNTPAEGATAGVITANIAQKNQFGAGVLVKGTFNMNAGAISNHGSKSTPLAVEGTGVCISGDSAVFTMNGGEISNNYADNKAGAGVSLRDGKPTFTMNGGKITANHTTGNVGGMVIRGAATFTMNEGAIISDNTAGTGKVGGGISMDGTATFVLNGGVFSGNTMGNVNNDINLASGSAHIKLAKQLTSDIHVSHHKSTYATTIQVAAKHNDISDEHFQNSMKYIVMQPKGNGDWFVNVDGYLAKAVALLQSNGGNTRYATLESAVSAAEEGETIKILENVEIANPITKALTFTSDKAVTIKAADNMKNIMFSIAKGKTMNITGAAADKKISINAGQSGKNAIQSYGTVNLTNVSTSGGQRGLYIGGGTAILTNVSISACTGEGLRVDAGGVNVTASGLYIDNTGSNGVYLKGASGNKATGTITNFEIKGTKSAAVKVQNSDLELKKGRIETGTYCLVTSDASSQLDAKDVTIKTTFGTPFSINGNTPTSYQGVTFEQ